MPGCWPRSITPTRPPSTPPLPSAVEAQRDWAHWRFEDRAAVFLRAADLLARPYRQRLNAATMLGQSKTAYQAEIDSACELIDFLRFNVHFAERIYQEQPESAPGAWNRMDHRPLEGFVYAITPFNFTAIGGNLPTAPALMGNAVVWKPSHTAVLSNWHFYKLLEEAGLPPGRHQLRAGRRDRGEPRAARRSGRSPASTSPARPRSSARCGRRSATTSRATAAIRASWARRAARTSSWPTPSADVDALAVAMVRGAYEYQGQKCSAASRAYIPDSLWPAVRDRVVGDDRGHPDGRRRRLPELHGRGDRRPGVHPDPRAPRARPKPTDGVKIVAGGGADDSVGYFIQPTLLQVEDPGYRTMCEELFGPVLTTYVYPAAKWTETLALVDRTGPYALTGAVFARDRSALVEADRALRQAAGNYYVNDKPTGAVVGQQPFGGEQGPNEPSRR